MSFRKIAEGAKLENSPCIISQRRKHRGGFLYIITDGEGELEFESNEFLNPGQELHLSGTVVNEYGYMKVRVSKVEKAEGIYASFLAKAEANAEVKSVPFLADGFMEKMRERILGAARKLLAAKKMGRTIFLRFHNDADGIAGALALTRIVGMQTSQQNSANYTVQDCMRDIGNLQYEKKPLVILLDFGCGVESREGLKLLKASGAEILIIDHHPDDGKAGEVADLFVSPWAFSDEENASHYTAGYLAVEIARAAGHEAKDLAGIACAGDKSSVVPVSEKEKEIALVLDYMATYSGFGNKLDFYKNALEKKELYDSVLVQARDALDRITDQVKANMKKALDGPVSVFTVDIEKIKSKEFPGKGKITTRGFELAGTAPAVVLGVWKDGLSFRINDGAIQKGVHANLIIEAVKEEMPDFIEGGGGHARAASLRIREGFVNSVVEKIVEKVKELSA